jgi:hypothetical protein
VERDMKHGNAIPLFRAHELKMESTWLRPQNKSTIAILPDASDIVETTTSRTRQMAFQKGEREIGFYSDLNLNF